MSETIYSPFAASGALETFVPSEEDFIVNTQSLGMPSQPTTQAPAAPRVDSQFRTYAPPPAGSFDPYTAGITGNIPSFFIYREPPPPALTPAPTAPVIPSDSDGGGGDSGGPGAATVGGGTGYGPIGSTTEGAISGLGPNPGTMDRGFGQATYGPMGSTIGTLAGMATGVPGLGLGLGALGTLADVRGLNADLDMMGLPQDIAFGPAFASNMTGGFFGTPAATQFGNALGFEAFAEAPLSAFAVQAGGPAAPSGPPGMTEADAMAAGMQSPGFGTGSYGFGTSPSMGGSGNFGAMSATERGETVGPPGSDAYGAAAAAAAAQAQANVDAANIDADAQPGGVNDGPGGPGAPGGSTDSAADSPGAGGGVGADGGVGSGGDAWKEGGIVKLAGGGLVPLAGGGKIAIGPGGGLDDLIPTSINGRRAAALSDGEFVIPADVVSMMGDGSSNAGARRLYDLVKQVRDVKTGTTKQAGPLPVGDILKRSMGR